MLAESLLQALAGLANILHGAVGNPTADGIADVGCVAVHGRVQVNLIAGGSGLEGLSWLDIGAWPSCFQLHLSKSFILRRPS